MARPSKLTEETQKKIVDAISVGATYEIAAGYAGIAYNTFNEWMKTGEAAKAGRFHEFREAVKKAEGTAAVKWLAVIDKAMLDEWQPAAWKLERRYPRSYGRQVTEHSGTITTVTQTVDDWRKEQETSRQRVAQTIGDFDE